MPIYRIEKLCGEYMMFQHFKRAGENVFLEGMQPENIYFVKKGLFVS